MEYVGIFYGHSVYCTAICYILWQFGIFCGNLIYTVLIWYIVSRFGMLRQEKSGNPAVHRSRNKLICFPSCESCGKSCVYYFILHEVFPANFLILIIFCLISLF
jgi:hypothetical protein